MRGIITNLLAAQIPVLSWWALANVATRASATITMTAIFVTGIWLYQAGTTTVGEVVAFMSLATALRGAPRAGGRLRQRPVPAGARRCAEFFEILDTVPAVRDRPHARQVAALRGRGHLRGRRLLLRRQAPGAATASRSRRGPARRSRWSAPPARASRRRSACCTAAFDPQSGAIRIDGDRHPRRRPRLAAPQHRRGVPGADAVRPLDPREPAGRPPRRHRRRDARRPGARAGQRVHGAPARRARHGDRRARPLAVGRRAPAALDRPGAPEEPADPDPRRGDLGARRRHRAQAPGRAGEP